VAKEIVIFITAASNKEAKTIANELLNKKKVACVNIVPKISSFFIWKGKRESCKEVLLIAKSSTRFIKDIIKLVKKIHSYEVPEIISLPIVGGNKDYLKWIREVTSSKEK
jgi:periplasmic divalent cation tolerance protein